MPPTHYTCSISLDSPSSTVQLHLIPRWSDAGDEYSLCYAYDVDVVDADMEERGGSESDDG